MERMVQVIMAHGVSCPLFWRSNHCTNTIVVEICFRGRDHLISPRMCRPTTRPEMVPGTFSPGWELCRVVAYPMIFP